ncbi:MAG TPA: FecR family protein [Myxococcota bacterium]|nr:FecR family protein [Myxococcota bacterium]HRY96364.1 FecR family protein [Myxococcota bacterium]
MPIAEMKKMSRRMARTRMIAWALGLALLLLPGLSRAGEGAATGFVAAAKGEAFVVRGEERQPARVGLEVRVGDVLETGRKARLKVLLTDDSVLSLGGETRLMVEQHLFEPGRARATNLKLMGGRARALVQQVVGGSRAKFEISTGTAVAGVRGTEFVVEKGEGGERVVTLSGSVEWQAAGGQPVLVAAGEGSGLEGGRVGQPTALAAAELRELRTETESDSGPEALAWNLGPADRLSGRTGPAAPAEEARGEDERQAGGGGAAGEASTAFGGIPVDGQGNFGGLGMGAPVGDELGEDIRGAELEAAGLVHMNVLVHLRWEAPRRGARR